MNQPLQYTIQQLQDLILLTKHLSGEAPKEIRVTQDFFNFYREQTRKVAENFNLQHSGIKDDQLQFMGVKLLPIVEVLK